MLDTNICIHANQSKTGKSYSAIQERRNRQCTISSITLCELRFGAYNSSKPPQNLKAILKSIAPLEVLSFVEAETGPYSKIR